MATDYLDTIVRSGTSEVLESTSQVTSPQMVTEVDNNYPIREYQRNSGRVFGVGGAFDPANTDEARANRLMTLAFRTDTGGTFPVHYGEMHLYPNFEIIPLYPDTDNKVGKASNKFAEMHTKELHAEELHLTADIQTQTVVADTTIEVVINGQTYQLVAKAV